MDSRRWRLEGRLGIGFLRLRLRQLRLRSDRHGGRGRGRSDRRSSDRLRGDLDRGGLCRAIQVVDGVASRDRDRHDGRQKELPGPHRAPIRRQRRGDRHPLSDGRRGRYLRGCRACRRRSSGWRHCNCLGPAQCHRKRRAAVVAAGRSLVIDCIASVAWLELQRRRALVAEPGTRWIVVMTEGAHAVAKIRGARGEGPGRGGLRGHGAILSLHLRARAGLEQLRLLALRDIDRLVQGALGVARLAARAHRPRLQTA